MTRKPLCIIITGRPGSGKTTLAYKLKELLWMPVISRDEIKEGYVNTLSLEHDKLPDHTNRVVTNFFFEVINKYLNNQISIIIEAAFQHKVWSALVPGLLARSNPIMLLCTIDGEGALKRELERDLGEQRRGYYHGNERRLHYLETGKIGATRPYQAPDFDIPTIKVQTEKRYTPSLEELVHLIESEKDT